MANAANTQDLLKGALRDVGELTDGNTDKQELALARMNDVYLSVLSGASEFNVDCGEPWTWCRNPTPRSIILRPIYETGTVAINNASTSGTFSSAPSSSLGSFAGRYLKVVDRPTVYLITAHVAGATGFTIDQAYLEATVTASAFKAIPTRYDLGSGILRLVEAMRVYSDQVLDSTYSEGDRTGKIYGIGLSVLREKFPIQTILQGTPTNFATSKRSDTEWVVEMSHVVSPDPVKVDFDYIPFPEGLLDSTESIPVIPREFRKVLRYGTAHYLAADKGATEQSKYFYLMTQNTLKAMVRAENRNTTLSGKNKGVMLPRQEQLTKFPRRGY